MSKAEKYSLILWFIANLTIGLLLVHDFGMSYDEPNYYLYAKSSVDAYRSVFGLVYTPDFGLYPNYGPAFRLPAIRLLLLVVLAFPGLYAIVRLHPYEYIYYNSFVGGIRGADGHFELDYWRTSLPNLALELNNFAVPHSKVVVEGFLGN